MKERQNLRQGKIGRSRLEEYERKGMEGKRREGMRGRERLKGIKNIIS